MSTFNFYALLTIVSYGLLFLGVRNFIRISKLKHRKAAIDIYRENQAETERRQGLEANTKADWY
jgi:hypothetical protein